ncbi:ABC transporter ATP-binding protein [Opitutales bacterium ASA1]|uniref:ABC transporter ATP-binding protein n=1 Tax=Congregicoccus parvus TaxID=3081749 RepID=UPI002B311E61|nr:ABC transporter ATP-binding protein [Opitutales bacterium ASA1]
MSLSRPQPAVRVTDLCKDYRIGLRGLRLRAVDGLSFTVPRGSIFGLLGPNGSGKSTTIKAILGLIRPSTGVCEVFGADPRRATNRVSIGYLPESPDFQRFLTGREFVSMHARFAGLGKADVSARTEQVVALVGMSDAADRRVGEYSKGMLQRIGLAQALVHDPELLVLDEPTAGVDPVGTADVITLVRNLRDAGKTILLSSHLLAQVEDVCDQVAIVHRGRLVFAGALDDLEQASERRAIVVDRLDSTVEKELAAWLATRGSQVVHVDRPRARLDKVFLSLVARGEGKADSHPTAP